MRKNTVEIAILLDFFGKLLTDKQQHYMDLYYNEDFSLSEISALEGVTPQAVRDALKRSEFTLLDIEEKTGLVARFRNHTD